MIPDNNNIIDIETFKTQNGNNCIKHPKSIYRQDMYVEAIYDEKDFVSFVKAIEKQVRNSDEYTVFCGVLKFERGLNACAILNNIKEDIENEMAEIQFHHYPFTLYDICSAVLEDMLLKKEKVSTFLVSKKVIQLHLDNLVGVVPLCKTIHELVHAGRIFVNLNQVYGYYDQFIEMYKHVLPEVLIDNYNKLVEMSKENVAYSEDEILEYINVKDR